MTLGGHRRRPGFEVRAFAGWGGGRRGYGVGEAAVAELTEGCGCCRAWRNRAGLVCLLGALGRDG